MAKALIGFLDGDLRTPVAAENARLRRRVAELEAVVLRLSEENDALRLDALRVPDAVDARDLQPA